MADLTKLSRREREIMEIVFAKEGMTLTEILSQVDNPPTRPALRSILTILESKGKLRHQKRGREFVFFPTEARGRVGRSALQRVVDTFFSGSLGQAVASHLNDPSAELSDAELRELEALIQAKRRHTASH